ncbi:MAG: site-2 protease family protein [Akkermansiaceae bacterium]|nr:site-2 protease family protein [Akkermansiaceae bacterium]
MFRFSIFGIPVEVQPFFWVSLVLLGGADRADSMIGIFRVLLFVLAGFISILTHELGHALTARAFGAHSAISLQAFGGYAFHSGRNFKRWQNFLITAAGPLVQIALALATFLLLNRLESVTREGKYFLNVLMVISFFWAALNLLPIIPLDGGHMLNSVLGPARIKITLWTTIIVAVVVGLWMFTQDSSFIFPIILGMYAWKAHQALRTLGGR